MCDLGAPDTNVCCILVTPNVASAAGQIQKVTIKFHTSNPTVVVDKTFNVASILAVTPKVNITYVSSNTKIATIATKGIAKGITEGKTTITVTTSKKGYTGKSQFTFLVTALSVSAKIVTY